MRVESETGSLAVVDSTDHICAAIREGANLRGEADGSEFGRKQRGGLRLPSWGILRVDGDEPFKEAGEASDIGRRRSLRKGHCTFPLAETS